MTSEPGHKDSFGAPSKGWPEFCRRCGRRLKMRDTYYLPCLPCWVEQEDEA